jgi:REP-associated tyrosine transposase
MARPHRIEFPGALYHVIARGIERRNIFQKDEGKATVLSLLSLLHNRHNIIIYAYCIMDNHYHLLLETPDGNLSRGMQGLNSTYALRFNRKYNRCGPLFQGRYKAYLVEKESYLLALSRYIVLNPVRAMIVSNPSSYAWSSYLYTLHEKKPPDFLATDLILTLFSQDRRTAQREFREFIQGGIHEANPQDKARGIVLGKESYVANIKERFPKIEEIKEIPRKERFLNAPSLQEIFRDAETRYMKETRNHCIYSAFKEHGYTQKEIADQLDIDHSTVSYIIRQRERVNWHKKERNSIFET